MNKIGRGRRRTLRAATAGAALAGLLLAGPQPASAADPDPSTSAAAPAPPRTAEDELTWSVGPQPEEEGAARPVFQYEVEPGQTIKDTLRVRVLGADPIDFTVYPADAFLTDEGAFDVLPAGKPSTDIGAWVRMATDHLTVGGNEVTLVPFTIKVPDNATPGDHVGGVVTSISETVDAGQAGAVKVDRRLGARIYLRVAGELKPAVSVGPPSVSFRGAGNPVGAGSATVTYTVTNTGNTRVQARRSTTGRGWIGGRTIRQDIPELLPGSSLTLRETVSGIRLGGRVSATAAVEPRPSSRGELPTPEFAAVRAAAGMWAVAASQLVLLALGALAALAVLVRRRRSAGATGEAVPQPVPAPDAAAPAG